MVNGIMPIQNICSFEIKRSYKILLLAKSVVQNLFSS